MGASYYNNWCITSELRELEFMKKFLICLVFLIPNAVFSQRTTIDIAGVTIEVEDSVAISYTLPKVLVLNIGTGEEVLLFESEDAGVTIQFKDTDTGGNKPQIGGFGNDLRFTAGAVDLFNLDGDGKQIAFGDLNAQTFFDIHPLTLSIDTVFAVWMDRDGTFLSSADSIGLIAHGDGSISMGTNVKLGALNVSGTINVIDLNVQGGQTWNVTTVNAATYDLLVTDMFLDVTFTTTGAVTSLTLPTAQTVDGRVVIITDAGNMAGVNSITIDTEGSELINGSSTAVISSNGGSISLYARSSNWRIF